MSDGAIYISDDFDLYESPEWTEAKKHEPKTSERPLWEVKGKSVGLYPTGRGKIWMTDQLKY